MMTNLNEITGQQFLFDEEKLTLTFKRVEKTSKKSNHMKGVEEGQSKAKFLSAEFYRYITYIISFIFINLEKQTESVIFIFHKLLDRREKN